MLLYTNVSSKIRSTLADVLTNHQVPTILLKRSYAIECKTSRLVSGKLHFHRKITGRIGL